MGNNYFPKNIGQYKQNELKFIHLIEIVEEILQGEYQKNRDE